MALGDGIRRNIATVSREERDLFMDAVKQLNQRFYDGTRTDSPPGHVSFWFKQDEIHDSTHVHGCPAFLPWHREMCNRFEASLREIHPELSLHYWDWNTDPSHMADGDGGFINLFDSDFMGNADGSVNGGEVGDPLLSAGFYTPGAVPDRDNPPNNPADPITSLTRAKRAGSPPVGGVIDGFNWPSDSQLLNAASWEEFNDLMIGVELLPPHTPSNNGAHAGAHSYIGGDIGDPHTSFRDPFVFLLHSNVDRLWAMWQRLNSSIRLDPAQVYGSDGNSTGSGDVSTLHPNWGIRSPLEPWAGPGVQTTATGIISNVVAVRPWVPGAPPDNQQVFKDSRDLTVVIPPSYDTAPHSSYIVTDRDTFSTYELESVLSYPQSFYVIYDGFTPNELGLPGPTPAISFLDAPNGTSIGSISAVNPVVTLENAAQPTTPQRISFAFDINFTDPSAFPVPPAEGRNIFLRANFVGLTDIAAIHLINQPNPFMEDGPISWLSTDVRVFQLRPNEALTGSFIQLSDPDTNSNAPYDYIQALLTEFRGFGNSPNLVFEAISQDEQASELELSRTVGGVRVLNFAVAKVRYRANTQDAHDVRVFFRTFNTMVSALDYNIQTNYRRSADGTVALLGTIGSEIASIPYFAEPRVNSATQDMSEQHDSTNKQTISHVVGQESVQWFGCWLDFNQTEDQFPLHPSGDGHFTNRLPLLQIVRGIHQCLVAEIRFQPGANDPIPTGASPAASDRLAQRNLAIVQSDNPGTAETHIVQHTLLVKPSIVGQEKREIVVSSAPRGRETYDELVIRWHNLPRDTKATLFFPEWKADEVLLLASVLRQRPSLLKKVDAHTIECTVTDISYIPIPGVALKPYAGLITLQLPQTVRDGQLFRIDVQQHSGFTVVRTSRGRTVDNESAAHLTSLSVRRVLGAFRMTIPVKIGKPLLGREVRNLAVLRYIAQAIPTTDRWYPIFVRYIGQVADKVRGLGVDPALIKPSANDPGIPGSEVGHSALCYTGMICEVIYDCFGDFEGFVLETCSNSHRFNCRKVGIAEIVLRACRDRMVVSVCVERGGRGKILGIVLRCEESHRDLC
jgi:Common central domain of tyrosinase